MDMKVLEVRTSYEDYSYRTPIKFGGTASDRVTLLNVTCIVRTRTGKTAKGFGSMPLGNIWAFPSRKQSYDDTYDCSDESKDKGVQPSALRVRREHCATHSPANATYSRAH